MKESKSYVNSNRLNMFVSRFTVAFGIFLMGFTNPVLSTPERPSSYSSSEALLPMLMALGVIIFSIYVIAWVAKKLNLTPHINSHFKTVTSVSLGGRERIVVVELNGKQYALGVTSNSINLLFEIDENIETKSFAMQDNKMLNKLADLLNNDTNKVKNQ